MLALTVVLIGNLSVSVNNEDDFSLFSSDEDGGSWFDLRFSEHDKKNEDKKSEDKQDNHEKNDENGGSASGSGGVVSGGSGGGQESSGGGGHVHN